ncbi:putative endonuclease [Lachnospiraceae bacterium RM5]|nr:putative endonuclease [Lachnospiraceae bacterium RM5]
MNKRRIGEGYEKFAGKYLISLGYEIIEYNFKCKSGEIDIIARDGNYLVFVEVKYRKSENYGMPIEAVDFRKQNKIRGVANYYLLKTGYNKAVRFDIIGILGEKITHIKNAF